MEKLRKLFWALGSVLVVLFALTFSSCSDDDDHDKDKGDASSLVGTWRFNDDGVYYSRLTVQVVTKMTMRIVLLNIFIMKRLLY